MSVFIIPDWILFPKTLLVKVWSNAVVLVLITLVGRWIRGRNPFLKT